MAAGRCLTCCLEDGPNEVLLVKRHADDSKPDHDREMTRTRYAFKDAILAEASIVHRRDKPRYP